MSKIDRTAIAALEYLEGTTPNKTLLEEVLDTYFDSSPALVEKMKSSVANGDLKGMKGAAHSLKSSSALVGAAELSEACRTIEALNEIDDRARSLVASAATEFQEVVSALNEIVKDMRGSRG